MTTSELPKTVRQAWGSEAAEDFVSWLNARLANNDSLPEFHVSPLTARQKVNVLMLERISNLLLASEPSLTQLSSQQWVWRVPIDLTFPSHGRVGCVGVIDIDAQSGEILYTQALLAEISTKTQQLTQNTLHSTA